MRTLLIALAALTLSACNMVYTDKPLFTTADARGAAKLKPGLWVNPEKDCAFDAADAKLPDCANAVRIDADNLLPPPGAAPIKAGEMDRMPYVLVAGDPPIMQVQVKLKDATRWLYAGLKPVRTEGRGRILETRIWMAQCGPPPPKGGERFVTAEPLPGLTVVENDCVAADQAAVRNAARASEAWDDDKGVMRWLKE